MTSLLVIFKAFAAILIVAWALVIILQCLTVLAFIAWLFSDNGRWISRPGEGLFDGR